MNLSDGTEWVKDREVYENSCTNIREESKNYFKG